MELFRQLLSKFSKSSGSPAGQATNTTEDEDLQFFYLRSKSGFEDARKFVTSIGEPRLVAIQCLSLPKAPYASIIYDRAVFVLARLENKEAIRRYSEHEFRNASDKHEFMNSLEEFIEKSGWAEEKLPNEDTKALLYRAWKALSDHTRIPVKRPLDDLDHRNKVLSFGEAGMFPFTFSQLRKQFDLEKRWFIANRYALFSLACLEDDRVVYYTILSITGNDLFVLNCFDSEQELMSHRNILNGIFEDLTDDSFKKISDYMVHYGRRFSLSESSKDNIVESAANTFDIARDDLTKNQTIYGDNEELIDLFKRCEKKANWEPLIS